MCWGLALIAAILSACQAAPIETQPADPQPESTPGPLSTYTPRITEATAPTPAAAASSAPAETARTESLPLTHYTLTAVLNYAQHNLSVDEQILYVNRSGETIIDLRLMIDPLYYPGAFRLNTLSWSEGQPVSGHEIEGAQMRIPLRQPLAPGGSIALALNYDLSLPSPRVSEAIRPIPFGYTSRQTNLVDWYPFIPPYKPGEGWVAHKAGFFGEHLVYESADFDVSIQITDNRPELTIAASAAASRDGDWQRYSLRSARNFAWSVSHQYQVTQMSAGEVSIISYAFPEHAKASEAVLRTTADSLTLYNELYGPYPHSMLTVVEADFLDGMEYDGLYFLSNGFYNLYQGTTGEYLVAIAAHETAHQWFYGLVGNDQALEPWLDEALCTYSERIYYERLHPEALDWWWDYRVNYYQPRGFVDGSIYNPEGYRAYRDAIYLNGAVFLESLRSEIGDQSFFEFIQAYVQNNAYKIATAEDFFEELKKFTDQDLTRVKSPFFLSVD